MINGHTAIDNKIPKKGMNHYMLKLAPFICMLLCISDAGFTESGKITDNIIIENIVMDLLVIYYIEFSIIK